MGDLIGFISVVFAIPCFAFLLASPETRIVKSRFKEGDYIHLNPICEFGLEKPMYKVLKVGKERYLLRNIKYDLLGIESVDKDTIDSYYQKVEYNE